LAPRGRPSRQSVLADLDRAKSELAGVGGLPKPEEAQSIWEGIWHEETHHSTAIEGNTMVLNQVKILLDEGRAVGNKELTEYLEIRAYADAAQWVYEHAVDAQDWRGTGRITLTELRHVHTLVVEPVWRFSPPSGVRPEEGPGAFRRHDIEPLASGHRPPPWPDVPARVDAWITEANSDPQADVPLICHLADLHARLEQIHPFLDGNGRTGRLVLNLMLIRSGYPPAIVYKTQRGKYLAALRRFDRHSDAMPLAELLARAVKHSIDRFVLPGLAGPHKLVPLSALVTRRLSALALRRAAEKSRLRAVRRRDQWVSTKQWVDEYEASRRRGRRPAKS
jgi:Fic family protein